MVSEGSVVSLVERSLAAAGRYYLNVYGDVHADNGSPDIVTMDVNGSFTGIECKRPGKEPAFTQWQHAVRILSSASTARYIVAYDDFDVARMDDRSLPVAKIARDEVDGAFSMKLADKTRSVEIVLEADGIVGDT